MTQPSARTYCREQAQWRWGTTVRELHLADASLITQLGLVRYDSNAERALDSRVERGCAGSSSEASSCLRGPRVECDCPATRTIRITATAAASAETRAVTPWVRTVATSVASRLPGCMCAVATAATADMLRPTSKLCTRVRNRMPRACMQADGRGELYAPDGLMATATRGDDRRDSLHSCQMILKA